MRLYFARHGQSVANVLRVISNRDAPPHPLTDLGRQQAATLADSLSSRPIAAIFTSPLLRAVQTAEILSARLGVPFQTTDALREYDLGVLEGTTGEATWARYAAYRADWQQGRLESCPAGRRELPGYSGALRPLRASLAGRRKQARSGS